MAMDVLDLMETKLSSFTKTDRAVYERLKKYPKEFAHDSYEDIVNSLDVSPSALTRFAKKLGFAGYAELQYQLALDLEQRAQRTSEETIAQIFGSFLLEAENTLDRDALHTLAEHIATARRVSCLGFNLSSIPAQFLCGTLRAQLDINAECLSFDFVDQIYREGDVIVLLSVASGEWYRSFLQRMRKRSPRHQAFVTLVTMNPKHSLRRYADLVITLPTAGKVSRTHTATLENMLFVQFIDSLAAEIGQLKA